MSRLLKKIVLNCMTIFVISAYLCVTFAWQTDMAALNIEAVAAHVDIEVLNLDQIEVNLEELTAEPYEQTFTVENKSSVPGVMGFQLSASNEAAQTLLGNGDIDYTVLDENGDSLTTVELTPGMEALNLTLQITLSGEPDVFSDTAVFLFEVTARQVDNLDTASATAALFSAANKVDRDDIVIAKNESESSSADADVIQSSVETQQSEDSDKNEGKESSVQPPVSAATGDASSAASNTDDGVVPNE